MVVQSIIFNKNEWSINSAKQWLEHHGYIHSKVDVKPHFYRFRQLKPNHNKRFRTQILPSGIELILMY